MPKRARVLKIGPFGIPYPPSIAKIKKAGDTAIEGLSQIKEIPRTLVDRLAEADKDFRDADETLRGAKLRGKRKKRPRTD